MGFRFGSLRDRCCEGGWWCLLMGLCDIMDIVFDKNSVSLVSWSRERSFNDLFFREEAEIERERD